MSKYFLIIFLLFIFNISSSKADQMISIEKYLLDKDPRDYGATTYSLVRCSGLERFTATISFEKNPKLSEKFINMSADFGLAAAKYDSVNSSRTFEQSSKNITNSVDEIYKIYLEDGKKNWSKTGSYFSGSYIEEDNIFCAEFYKQIQKLLK